MDVDRFLTIDWLNQQFRSRGIIGGDIAVERVTVVETLSENRATVFRIGLDYAGPQAEAAPSTAIVKFCGPAAARDEGIPEISFLLDAQSLPTPRVYAAGVFEAFSSTAMVTEDLFQQYRRVDLASDGWAIDELIDAIARLHIAWWNHPALGDGARFPVREKPTRMPQAAPEAVVQQNLRAIQPEIVRFGAEFGDQLSVSERELLVRMEATWGTRFQERLASGRGITLIHGDLHLLGNVFVRDDDRSLRIIDWAEHKPGLGAHDIAYCLIPVDDEDRCSRDETALRRYHQHLLDAGISDFGWEQCLWDYRFSLLTNLLQSMLQGSPRWFHATFALVELWSSAELLEDAH